MDDQQLERLQNACIVVGEGITKALESMRDLIEAMLLEKWSGTFGITQDEKDHDDPMATLARAMIEMGGGIDSELLQEFAELANDMPPIIRKKMPRPPKSLRPTNKTNYTANRPVRRARSNCRIIKHR